MIKFTKKWGQVYAPPGGKFEEGESPLDCVLREFYEETGLTLKKPKLQGISYWKDMAEGIIFIYVAEEFEGNLKEETEEGCIKWIDLEDLFNLKQFSQNEKFTPYLFKEKIFEDSYTGVLASNNAGIEVVNIYDKYADLDRDKINGITDYSINNYKEFIELVNYLYPSVSKDEPDDLEI